MYGYDYESDVLLLLRLLKYLHEQDPKTAERLSAYWEKIDPEFLFDTVENILWEIFSDVEFDEDPEWEATIATFSHPVIDRLYELGRRLERSQGRHRGSWQQKIHDIVEFFICGASYSIAELNVRATDGNVKIKVRYSYDCYDPVPFGNSLVDVLLYCQQENERLEKLIEQAEKDADTELGEEAA